ncbi:MAG: TetR/AcrR family transcriptional regulator [Marmoricola sp.]
MPDQTKPYHHGSLRTDLIAAAVQEVEAVGAAGVSLREIARRAGVSHAAPTHHFTDKTGLFTAIATEGFRLSAEAISPVAYGTYGFLDGGAAYVLWALEHPGYFEVMYRPGLYRSDDPDLVAAKQTAFDVLEGSAADLASHWGIEDVPGLVLAGWSLCHGLATLTLAGNLNGRVSPALAELSGQLERGLAALGRVVETRLATRT